MEYQDVAKIEDDSLNAPRQLLVPVRKVRAARRAGAWFAGRVCEGVSEFVGGMREANMRFGGRTRSRESLTQTAACWPLTQPLPLTRTLTGSRRFESMRLAIPRQALEII